MTGKISQKRKITLEEFAYNRARATKQIKITFPSPLLFYSSWSPELSTAAYKDAYELFADAAAIIRSEIADLAAMGCTYIQVDAPDIGSIVGPGEPRDARTAGHADRADAHRGPGHLQQRRRTSPASSSACTSARETT